MNILTDPIFRNVILGAILLSVSSSLIGSFTFLRKRALIGDVIAHAVFPGICLGYLYAGEKSFIWLFVGAVITSFSAVTLLEFLKRNSKITGDTASAIILSSFFAIGTVLIAFIMRSPAFTNKAGLMTFLFGNTIGISQTDIWILIGIISLIFIVIFFFYKGILVISFDESYAKAIGYPTYMIKLVLGILTVFSVVLGVQAVGIVLISALLITPASIARFWTNRIKGLLFLAVIFAMFSAGAGVIFAYHFNAPTGPWIVIVLSLVAILSFMFAPSKGIIFKSIKHKQFKIKVMKENILKHLYKLGESSHNFFAFQSVKELSRNLVIPETLITKTLYKLKKEGLTKGSDNLWKLTPKGKNKGQRLIKLHRLWELYLTEIVNIKPDHVHDDADLIEHIITPELEQELERKLGFPKSDPHNSTIPY